MDIFLLLLLLISANTLCSVNSNRQKFVQDLEKQYVSARGFEKHKLDLISSTNLQRPCPQAPRKKQTQTQHYNIPVSSKAKRRLTFEIDSPPQSKL